VLLRETAEEKIAAVYELEKLTMAQDERIDRLSACVISTAVAKQAIVNSLGLDISQGSSIAVAYACPVATVDGVTKDSTGWRIAKNVAELDLAGIAKDAADELFGRFGAAPVESGKYRAVFKNEALADLLGVFCSMFSAEKVQKDLSLLKGKEGEKIAAECISITDDPTWEKVLCKSAFDDEGVAAQRTVVVKDGRLMSFLHNRKTAKVAGVTSTGNGGKAGIAGKVTVQPSNFFIEPGDTGFDALLKELGDGIVVTDISGLHAGCNPVSGDFSALAKGYRVENGVRTAPVEQITVSGNFLELMQSALKVGSDFLFDSGGAIGAPSVLFETLTVAGK